MRMNKPSRVGGVREEVQHGTGVGNFDIKRETSSFVQNK